MRPQARTHALGAVILLVAALGSNAAIARGDDGDQSSSDRHPDRPYQTVRQATRGLRDVVAANEAGYGQFLGCVDEPHEGAMGTHFVSSALVGDAVVDPDTPEALMFETRYDGSMQLVGVEYIVFQEAWDAANGTRPQLFGHRFHLVTSPNRYDLPPFYELHVWAWKHNPTGTFADWNPRVTCRFETVDG